MRRRKQRAACSVPLFARLVRFATVYMHHRPPLNLEILTFASPLQFPAYPLTFHPQLPSSVATTARLCGRSKQRRIRLASASCLQYTHKTTPTPSDASIQHPQSQDVPVEQYPHPRTCTASARTWFGRAATVKQAAGKDTPNSTDWACLGRLLQAIQAASGAWVPLKAQPTHLQPAPPYHQSTQPTVHDHLHHLHLPASPSAPFTSRLVNLVFSNPRDSSPRPLSFAWSRPPSRSALHIAAPHCHGVTRCRTDTIAHIHTTQAPSGLLLSDDQLVLPRSSLGR